MVVELFVRLLEKHRSYICLMFISLILTLLTLSPILDSGYIGDDTFESLTKGMVIDSESNIFHLTYKTISFYATNGRFDPFQFYYFFIYYLFDHPEDVYRYKCLILTTVFIDIILFGYLIKLLTNSTTFSILSLILPSLFFQARLYHDPILSYHLIQQLLFLYLITSLIFLIYYIKYNSPYFLAISLIIYTVSVLSYEISVAFSLIYLMVIINHKRKLKIFIPYVVIDCIAFIIPMFLRYYYNIPLNRVDNFSEYSPNLDISIYLLTLFKQTVAAFPLSYYIFDTDNIFYSIFNTFKNNFSATVLVIMIGYFIVFMEIFSIATKEFSENKDESGPIGAWYIVLFGVLLLLLPGIMISAVKKYQHELLWGYGYLPVYISYFGLVILTIISIYTLYEKFKMYKKIFWTFSIVVAILFSVIGSMNYMNNKIVVEHSNIYWKYPRSIIEDAMKDGLFDMTKNNDTLVLSVLNGKHPWELSPYGHGPFYVLNSGKRFKYIDGNTVSIGEDFKRLSLRINVSNIDKNDHFYSLGEDDCCMYYSIYDSYSPDGGYAILGKIKDIIVKNDSIYKVYSNDIYVYVRIPYDYYVKRHITITGETSNNSNSTEILHIAKDQLELVSYGRTWKMYRISNMYIDMESILITIEPYKIFFS